MLRPAARLLLLLILRLLLPLLLYCGMLPLAQAQDGAGATERQPPRQVLVLYSLGSDASSLWQTLIRRGLNAELSNQPWQVTPGIFEERLDSWRVGEQAAVTGLEAYLRTKYANVRLDAIITENYLAARFLSEHPKLFPGVPRFYVNHGRRDWQPADGANLDAPHDFGRALALMAQITPDLRRIAVIVDGSERGQAWLRAVRAAATPYQHTIAFEYWDQLGLEEVLRRTEALGAGSAILLLPYYRDALGVRVAPPEMTRDISARSAVPIFTSVESLILPGVVGGHVVSADKVGRTIARILQGRVPDQGGMQETIIDNSAIERFALHHLPPDARILNRPQDLWQRYHWQIIAGLALIVLQAGLITALVLALRGRRSMLSTLNAEREQLEERVLQRTLELLVANSRLEQQATTDPLTELGNRRKMTLRIAEEIERAQRGGHTLSLLMIDIDYFKRINDRHGHDAGDRTIVAVAQVLHKATRGMDTAARFGGEEFVLLMPETPLAVALDAAERLRLAVASLQVDAGNGQAIRLTISVGVAAITPTVGTAARLGPDVLTDLLIRADQALYRAKNGGRDRVEAAA
ncbi:diguanylate cyclase [Janthinobacterium aquaticum]|uniref:diguanylate cyclase n=1 Tax=Janthinobacterium sp. FT58W TaxID=2654254 RepID=UPI001D00A3FE|nr:diguanylate cyclase [Janthinobacterium sp. FT58W]